MKKFKRVMGALLRCLLLLAPSAVFLPWALTKVPVLFAILATLGAAAVYLSAFAFTVTLIQAARDLKKKKAEQSA